MIEQNNYRVLYGTPINPCTGLLFDSSVNIDSSIYKCRAIKKDLVDKFIDWSPTIYSAFGNEYYMIDVSNGGDADRCLTWKEVKDCENLSVTLYNSSDFSDNPSTYKFNGKDGQFPKLTISNYETNYVSQSHQPGDEYNNKELIYLEDIDGVFKSHTIVFKFYNILIHSDIQTIDDMKKMFVCTTNNVNMKRCIINNDYCEVEFEIIRNDANLNTVIFSNLKKTFTFTAQSSAAKGETIRNLINSELMTPLVYGAGEVNREFISNSIQHLYYTWTVDGEYKREYVFGNTVTNPDLQKIEFTNINSNHIVEIYAVYKYRSVVTIGTHKNINVYSVPSETTAGALPTGSKKIINANALGGSYMCDYKDISLGVDGTPRRHTEKGYIAFTVDPSVYSKVELFYAKYQKNDTRVGTETSASDYIDSMKNNTYDYVSYDTYQGSETGVSAPMYYNIKGNMTYHGSDLRELIYESHDGYPDNLYTEVGRITFFLTERFKSHNITVQVKYMQDVSVYVDLYNYIDKEHLTLLTSSSHHFDKLNEKWDISTGKLSSQNTVESNCIQVRVTDLPTTNVSGENVSGWYAYIKSLHYTSTVLKANLSTDFLNVRNNCVVTIIPSTYNVAKVTVITTQPTFIKISNATTSWSPNTITVNGNQYYYLYVSAAKNATENRNVAFNVYNINTDKSYKKLFYRFKRPNENWPDYEDEDISSKGANDVVYSFNETLLLTDKEYFFEVYEQQVYKDKMLKIHNSTSQYYDSVTCEKDSTGNGSSATVTHISHTTDYVDTVYELKDFANRIKVMFNFGNATTNPILLSKYKSISLEITAKSGGSELNKATTTISTRDAGTENLIYTYVLSSASLNKFEEADEIIINAEPGVTEVYPYTLWTNNAGIEFKDSIDGGTNYNNVALTTQPDGGRISNYIYTGYSTPKTVYLKVERTNHDISSATFSIYYNNVTTPPLSVLFSSDIVNVPNTSGLDIKNYISKGIPLIRIYNVQYYTKEITLIFGATGSATIDQDTNYQFVANCYSVTDSDGNSLAVNGQLNYASDSIRAYRTYNVKHPYTVSYTVGYPSDSENTSDKMNVRLYGHSSKISPYSTETFEASPSPIKIDEVQYSKDSGNIFTFSWTLGCDLFGAPLETTYEHYYIQFEAVKYVEPEPETVPILEFSHIESSLSNSTKIPTSTYYYINGTEYSNTFYVYVKAFTDYLTKTVYDKSNWILSYNTNIFENGVDTGRQYAHNWYSIMWSQTLNPEFDSDNNTKLSFGILTGTNFKNIVYDNYTYPNGSAEARKFYTGLKLEKLLVLTDNTGDILGAGNKVYMDVVLGEVREMNIAGSSNSITSTTDVYGTFTNYLYNSPTSKTPMYDVTANDVALIQTSGFNPKGVITYNIENDNISYGGQQRIKINYNTAAIDQSFGVSIRKANSSITFYITFISSLTYSTYFYYAVNDIDLVTYYRYLWTSASSDPNSLIGKSARHGSGSTYNAPSQSMAKNYKTVKVDNNNVNCYYLDAGKCYFTKNSSGSTHYNNMVNGQTYYLVHTISEYDPYTTTGFSFTYNDLNYAKDVICYNGSARVQ